MATHFRLATFNCENLFNRARVLNLRNKEKGSELLAKIGQLQAILEKDAYSPADKTKILAFEKELSLYIQIEEDRGKLFIGRGTTRRVSASGRAAWDGAVSFRRSNFSETPRASTAKVVDAVAADVLALVEIENRPTIDAFNSNLLTKKFPFNMLIDGFDPRGIDVGLLSKLPIVNIQTHIFDRDTQGRVFSRDCLEIEMKTKKGQSLFVLVNHFKSQGFGDPADNDSKRTKQAKAVAKIVSTRFDLSKDLVAVMGDFNDTPGRPPNTLASLLGLPGLTDVLQLQFADVAQRWTYHFKKNEQIDFILISDALKKTFVAAGVERRGMFKIESQSISGEMPFPEVTSAATAASDHAAVWADFKI